jgi:tetratricopeptide (TPR) repeat protein
MVARKKPVKRKVPAKKPAKRAAPKQKAAPKRKAAPKQAAAPRRAGPPKPPPPKATDAIARLDVVHGAHPGLVLDGEDRAAFARECPDLDALVAAYPHDLDILVRCVFAYRKQARFEDAQRVADLAIAVAPTWQTVSAKAGVYRAAKAIEPAIALFDEASRLDPEDTAALIEGARMLGEAGRFADAAAWFARVVERDPDNDDARVWGEYAGYRATQDPRHVEAVRALATRNPLAAHLLPDMA